MDSFQINIPEAEREKAREVFECFKKKRFFQRDGENAKEQSDKIKQILEEVDDVRICNKIVNWHHDKVYTHLLTLQQ